MREATFKQLHSIIVLTTVTFVALALLYFFIPTTANALDFNPKDSLSGEAAELIESDVSDLALGDTSADVVALNLINTALTLLGTLCVVLLIYGGFIWIWARGNQEEVQRAKDIIQGTIIGLIIVLASYGIVRYVFGTVGEITGAQVEDATEAEE